MSGEKGRAIQSLPIPDPMNPGPLDGGDYRIGRGGKQPDCQRRHNDALLYCTLGQVSNKRHHRDRTANCQQCPDLVVGLEERVVTTAEHVLNKKELSEHDQAESGGEKSRWHQAWRIELSIARNEQPERAGQWNSRQDQHRRWYDYRRDDDDDSPCDCPFRRLKLTRGSLNLSRCLPDEKHRGHGPE